MSTSLQSVSSRNFINIEKAKTSSTITEVLPVPAWQRIIHYLTEKEKRACAQVSKRIGILVLCDPSAELEKMHQRKVALKGQRILLSQTIGPSHRFFNSDSLSSKQSEEIRDIRIKMQKDPNVAKTVEDVYKIESLDSQYIPIYHAMNLNTYIFSIFTRILLSIPYSPSEKFPCDAPIIRFPSLEGPKTIEDFLHKCPMLNLMEWNDHKPAVQKELLSCNPHLFGNVTNFEESTFFYYLENQSLHPPDCEGFFKMLCKQYNLSFNQNDITRLVDLHKTLSCLAGKFAKKNLDVEMRKRESTTKGILLQILIPAALIDQIAYASRPFGKIDKTSVLSLSNRCLALRDDPLKDPAMQVRLLIQSLFVPDHHIQGFTHGCGGFFSEKDPVKLDKVSLKDWEKQKKYIDQKKEVFTETEKLFSKMILNPKSQKT